YLMRQKQVKGFQTGDRVRAIVPAGKKTGSHTGRVAIRKTGIFNIQTEQGAVQGISWRHCTLLQRGDGYGYHPFNTKGGADREPRVVRRTTRYPSRR
ncbi:HNH endonuclease, partial [Vreelandella rituensis]